VAPPRRPSRLSRRTRTSRWLVTAVAVSAEGDGASGGNGCCPHSIARANLLRHGGTAVQHRDRTADPAKRCQRREARTGDISATASKPAAQPGWLTTARTRSNIVATNRVVDARLPPSRLGDRDVGVSTTAPTDTMADVCHVTTRCLVYHTRVSREECLLPSMLGSRITECALVLY
jgi:hypothetical protein